MPTRIMPRQNRQDGIALFLVSQKFSEVTKRNKATAAATRVKSIRCLSNFDLFILFAALSGNVSNCPGVGGGRRHHAVVQRDTNPHRGISTRIENLQGPNGRDFVSRQMSRKKAPSGMPLGGPVLGSASGETPTGPSSPRWESSAVVRRLGGTPSPHCPAGNQPAYERLQLHGACLYNENQQCSRLGVGLKTGDH